jgi:hypothetical protein
MTSTAIVLPNLRILPTMGNSTFQASSAGKPSGSYTAQPSMEPERSNAWRRKALSITNSMQNCAS